MLSQMILRQNGGSAREFISLLVGSSFQKRMCWLLGHFLSNPGALIGNLELSHPDAWN